MSIFVFSRPLFRLAFLAAALVLSTLSASEAGALSPKDPLFVAPKALPAALNRDHHQVSILDVRKESAFAAGHLPRAQHIEWEDTRAGIFERGSLIGGKLPKDLGALVTLFAEHGVSLERPVLVCGAPSSGWGEEGRIAWTLLYLGHQNVHILDGGCAASPLATHKNVERVDGKAWTPKVNARIRAQRAAVVAAVKAQRVGDAKAPQILDVRTREEFAGATPYFEARGGHIQGAKHLHYQALLDDRGRLLPRDQLRAKLKRAGLDLDRPVIAYCTGGVRSAWAALALRSADVEAANYDGSMWEWAADARLPMALPKADETRAKATPSPSE